LANVNLSGFKDKLEEVKKDYDLVLIDCAAGLNEEALHAINSSDELLLITTPELPSVADVYKLVEYSENNWIPISGVVVNKESNSKYKDITIKDVEEILGKKVLEVIPKENEVEDSVNLKKPVVNIYPNSKSAKSFERLAYSLVGKEMPKEESMLNKILNLFKKQ
jgi:septum site-determining protein MinD